MNGPRGVRPLGGEHPQAPIRPHARALSRAPQRTPTGPRAGDKACRPPAQRAFPNHRQAPVAGRVPLPATGAYDTRSEASRGLSNPVGVHLNFALGLSNEVGPPQLAGGAASCCAEEGVGSVAAAVAVMTANVIAAARRKGRVQWCGEVVVVMARDPPCVVRDAVGLSAIGPIS